MRMHGSDDGSQVLPSGEITHRPPGPDTNSALDYGDRAARRVESLGFCFGRGDHLLRAV